MLYALAFHLAGLRAGGVNLVIMLSALALARSVTSLAIGFAVGAVAQVLPGAGLRPARARIFIGTIPPAAVVRPTCR
jgi:hypothetical protein